MGFWVFLSVCFFKVSGWNIVGEDFFPFFSFFSGVVKKTLWRPRVLRPAQNLPLKKTISHQSPRIQTRRCFVSRIRSTATIHRRKAGRGQPSKKGGGRISPRLSERSQGTTAHPRLECFPTTLTPQSKHGLWPSSSSPHFIPTQLSQPFLNLLCEGLK